MSTRCQVIVTDENDTIYFYRHCDGYPKGVLPTLSKFVDLISEGKIRNNVLQGAGWLIVLGAIEYQTLHYKCFPETNKPSYDINNKKVKKEIEDFYPSDWQVGSYEPCPYNRLHDDVAHVYWVDMEMCRVYEIQTDERREPIFSSKKLLHPKPKRKK